MNEKISCVDAEKIYKVSADHEEMSNGELRFRLTGSDGSGYIRTESKNAGGWQNSHYHMSTQEMYIVQDGGMAFAEYIDGNAQVKTMFAGDFVISNPGIVHNVYLLPNTIVHTVKFGEIITPDWHASLEFDEITKLLSERDIFSEK